MAGTAIVARAGYPDPTQFDAASDGYDGDSARDNPRWYGVDIRWESTFVRPLPLDELRRTPGLEEMVLFRRSRLSVQPVSPEAWTIIVELGSSRKPGRGG